MGALLKPIARKDGFTFIELVIVLSILAVLAGVVALSLSMFVGRGHTEACNADKSLIQSAVLSYYQDPDKATDWPTEDGSKPGDLFAEGFTSPLVGGYINEVPATDAKCDWHIDAQGVVVSNTDDCFCDTSSPSPTPTPTPTPIPSPAPTAVPFKKTPVAPLPKY